MVGLVVMESGFKIRSKRRSKCYAMYVECVDSTFCIDVPKISNGSGGISKPVDFNSEQTGNSVICSGDKFSCGGLCIEFDKACNGFPDCPDRSDEGLRNNHFGLEFTNCRITLFTVVSTAKMWH